MMTRRAVAAWILVLCTWASPAFGQSQAINGTIEGTVKDDQAGVLPGVTVTITHVETGTARVVVTNATGTYRAPLLPLGTYKIEYAMTGFRKFTRAGVTLAAGQTIVLNEALQVGAQEEVTVTADSPVVDLAKIDVGRNLTEREIKNLPMVSRNPYNFALLEPGVTGFENEEFGVPRFAVNGQMTRINYQVDGNTNTQKDRAGLRLIPMSEVMIREVQIVSSGYAPEFGQTTGMVYNAVTPSGSNRFTGDVGYRFRLKKWSAFPFFFTQPQTEANRPDNSLSIFTTSVGGPLKKNTAVLLRRHRADVSGAGPRDHPRSGGRPGRRRRAAAGQHRRQTIGAVPHRQGRLAGERDRIAPRSGSTRSKTTIRSTRAPAAPMPTNAQWTSSTA